MRAASVALVLAAIVLSGCSAKSPPADPLAPEAATEGTGRESVNGTILAPQDPPLRHEEPFVLSITGGTVTGPVSEHVLGNCIVLRDGAEIVGGNLTLTWTAQNPLGERLEVVVWVSGKWLVAGPSPSPMVVDLADLPPGTEGGATFSVQLPESGAAAQMPVDARMDLAYRGTVDFQDTLAGCTYRV